eukprot:160598-Rhodomonas_salina.1
MAVLELEINSPPLGGSFVACERTSTQAPVLIPGEQPCVKSGGPFSDYILLAQAWSDPDSPIMYEFGYQVVDDITGNLTQVQYEPTADYFKELPSLPSGAVLLRARAIDYLGASTPMLYDTIQVSTEIAGNGPARRVLQGGAAMAAARSKMLKALQTARPDLINQLAGSMAQETTKINPENARAMKGELLANLRQGSGKAIKTTSYACETLGSAAVVAKDADQLTETS